MKEYTCMEGVCVFCPLGVQHFKGMLSLFLCSSEDASVTSICSESVVRFVLFLIFYDETETLLVNILVSKAIIQ